MRFILSGVGPTSGGIARAKAMRSVTDYLGKAGEFERLAAEARNAALKVRYTDVANGYRMLAQERRRLIAEGILSDDRQASDAVA